MAAQLDLSIAELFVLLIASPEVQVDLRRGHDYVDVEQMQV